MQPKALSVEPLVIMSGLVFLFGILPLVAWITWKWRPNHRVPVIVLGLIVIVWQTFTLGRMTGLSMAWYHWKSEYKEPMWCWQIELSDMLKAGDTNGVVRSVRRFADENINAYGREKLFERGKFREFVEHNGEKR